MSFDLPQNEDLHHECRTEIAALRAEIEELKANDPCIAVWAVVTKLRAEVAWWEEMVAQAYRNGSFYRELLDKVAAHLGPGVYVSDDGSIQDSPIRLNIPEMVEALRSQLAEAEKRNGWQTGQPPCDESLLAVIEYEYLNKAEPCTEHIVCIVDDEGALKTEQGDDIGWGWEVIQKWRLMAAIDAATVKP